MMNLSIYCENGFHNIMFGIKQEWKKNWLQHLQRKPSERAPKQILCYRQRGRRNPGKPRRRSWVDI
jgi:hypothetical protein